MIESIPGMFNALVCSVYSDFGAITYNLYEIICGCMLAFLCKFGLGGGLSLIRTSRNTRDAW